MRKIAISLIALIALTGCLGQNGKSPVKQVAAFIISAPCSLVPGSSGGLGNMCYEATYEMMDSEENVDEVIEEKPGQPELQER